MLNLLLSPTKDIRYHIEAYKKAGFNNKPKFKSEMQFWNNLIKVERNRSTFAFDISMFKYNGSEAEIELILYENANLYLQ